MKKAITFLMFLSIMVISLTQGCNTSTIVPPGTSPESTDSTTFYELKDTLAIFLTSVKRMDGHGKYSYHLGMFDANGDCGIDSLVTVIKIDPTDANSGNIQWIKVKKSGIKKIVEIKSAELKPVIFRDSAYEHPHDVWNLKIPSDIHILPGEPREEKYIIKYIPQDKDTTITIDPYLRIPY